MSVKSKKVLVKQIPEFLRRYGRKAQAGAEPNDRKYDRKIEARLKQMKPDELDALMKADEDGDDDNL